APGVTGGARGYGSDKLPPKRVPMPDTNTLPRRGFFHEAVLYTSDDEFLDGTLQFVRDGFEAGEPTLVVVDRAKIRALRAELAHDGERLYFSDMDVVGRNPACIIPAWVRFVGEHGAGGALRGVGEPVWPGRSAPELSECHLHERLLNVAFAPGVDFWLRCPYDAQRLGSDVLDGVNDAHTAVVRDRISISVELDPGRVVREFAAPLPEPIAATTTHPFGGEAGVLELRNLVACRAREASLDDDAISDFVLAVHEVATNSVRHGGGAGVARLWRDDTWLVCEVHDEGHIRDPLTGRLAPRTDDVGGRGIWIANHLADLVQLRSSADGTTVRVHARIP
ncbi:MAG: anti-sigma factor RsbA family regulatory protein, partial [Acidimicrobiia bacterium]